MVRRKWPSADRPVIRLDGLWSLRFGVTFGYPVAVGFAASYPHRVQALVLAGGFAKLTRLGEFDFEADPGLVGEWASSTARAWGSGTVFGARAPSMRDSARYREWAARLRRGHYR